MKKLLVRMILSALVIAPITACAQTSGSSIITSTDMRSKDAGKDIVPWSDLEIASPPSASPITAPSGTPPTK